MKGDVRPLADAVDQAAGRPFWDLPDEFSVLAEPGTVGAVLREIRSLCDEFAGRAARSTSPRRCTAVRRCSRC